jgi:hypothetical protein
MPTADGLPCHTSPASDSRALSQLLWHSGIGLPRVLPKLHARDVYSRMWCLPISMPNEYFGGLIPSTRRCGIRSRIVSYRTPASSLTIAMCRRAWPNVLLTMLAQPLTCR